MLVCEKTTPVVFGMCLVSFQFPCHVLLHFKGSCSTNTWGHATINSVIHCTKNDWYAAGWDDRHGWSQTCKMGVLAHSEALPWSLITCQSLSCRNLRKRRWQLNCVDVARIKHSPFQPLTFFLIPLKQCNHLPVLWCFDTHGSPRARQRRYPRF